MKRRLTPLSVERLREEFGDLAGAGRIDVADALPEEANEPELARLPRLVLSRPKINFGRIRQLIDRINLLECEAAPLDPPHPHEGRA
jgi:hypothetical protein